MSRARRVAFWTLREWMEVLAGEKAVKHTGQWLSEETHEAFREYRVGIKGPLTTPVGGGIRSLNVALPQPLDFYACVRPVRHFSGVPSPVRDPRKVDMVVFRENTEDMYAGFELEGEKEEIAVLWITSVPLTDGGSGPIQRSGSNPLADRAAAGSFGQPSTMPSGTAEGASPWSRKGTSRSSRKGPS